MVGPLWRFGAPIAVLGVVGEDASAVLAELGGVAAPAPTAIPVAPTRIFASPLAGKLLKEAGIPLDAVAGTGPNGRIMRKDVEAAIAQGKAVAPTLPVTAPAVPPPVVAAPSTKQSGAAFTEIPHSRVRAVIARRLTASKQTVPHFYVRRTARIDALLDLRRQLNAVSPTRISVNDLIIRAVAVAHVAVPDANVIWTDDAMRRYDSVDIGVATASARGLVTPVLRNVSALSLSAISTQVKEFARQADDGRLRQRDLDGGTIAMSNLGSYGVDEFAAIINPPQSAILAVAPRRRWSTASSRWPPRSRWCCPSTTGPSMDPLPPNGRRRWSRRWRRHCGWSPRAGR
jgi:pyruvate dehydrogenase E2 component (dihydrolipoamide acetyltransferase)